MTLAFDSAADVYNVGREIYPLQCMRRTHGDDAVLQELKQHFIAQGDPVSDAYIHAGRTLKTVDALVNNEFEFKAMRARLDAKQAPTGSTLRPLVA